ncbi:hypothetical protein Tco_0431635 [Tanacetum coccineum]
MARRPLHWKVIEEVYHGKSWQQDVVDDDQDVIHGNNSSNAASSSNVAMSDDFYDLDYTSLIINNESIEVDDPPDSEEDEDNDFIVDEGDFAHDIGDDDEDDDEPDDEVDPASVHVVPQSHGGDAGGDPPQRPTKRIPSQCEGSGKRGVSKHQNLKKAFKNNASDFSGPIELEFEWKDQETFKALGTHGTKLHQLNRELSGNTPGITKSLGEAS